MKKHDFYFILFVLVLFLPFIVSKTLLGFFIESTTQHPFLMSFLKFGILSTMGEVIGLRIKTGHYNQKGFGILPRAITWGFLGMLINMGFIIFGQGAPKVLEILNIVPQDGTSYASLIQNSIFETGSWYQVLAAFAISTTLNCLFAPVFMTLHKISDSHISATGGSLKGYFSPWHFGELFSNLDWKVMWNFLFRKTVPYFWIPAHTITFLLPPVYRVLFAAMLGIVLGIFMSVASVKSTEKQPQAITI